MGSIEAGRPPDGDSCSDEDENSALSRAEQDQQAVPFRPSQWIPIAQSFRPYVDPSGGCTRNHGRAEGSRAEEQKVVTRRLVSKLTKYLADTYKVCNPEFTCSVVPRRYLTTPSKGVSNDEQDNKDTDLILYAGCVLVNSESNIRYVVKDMLGKGSFGQVCKCSTRDTNYQGDVAVKVIKNHPAYYNQAKVEIGICWRLNMYDKHNIVRILDHFEFAGHLCLVFELLNANLNKFTSQNQISINRRGDQLVVIGFNVYTNTGTFSYFHVLVDSSRAESNDVVPCRYELLKLNSYKGLSMKLVRRFTIQILKALIALREAGVLHCDLKPENILLQPSWEAAEIKLIDFGSACMDTRIVYTYIQSRFYRSPEVLLQLKYTTAIDMWSLGCVAAELFLGLPLFPGACEYDLLRFMIEILGCQPPDRIIHQSEISNKFFKLTSSAPLSGQMATDGQPSAYQFLTEVEFEAREQKKPKFGKRYFGHNRLEDIIVSYPTKGKRAPEVGDEEVQSRIAFIDFLKGVLQFDPSKRWTPGQEDNCLLVFGIAYPRLWYMKALHHPFLTEKPFLGPFRPPPEQIRPYVGQWMAMDHNANIGHWFSGGLSPQVNINAAVRYPNPGYHGSTIPYNGSYSSAGSFGSYGDGTGLGSSVGSYGDSIGMHHSYSNTPGTGMNGHNHGGAAGGGFVGSPDTYHHRLHVSNVPTFIGVSPSNYRPVPLGASPSHHHQATPSFYGSPGSGFLPSPISYGASPSSIHHMSPNSQLMLSPSSPSHLSPGRTGPTSPARAGASALPKIAYQNTYRNRQHGSQYEWARCHYPNANGNDSYMRGAGPHGSNFPQKHRSGPGVTQFGPGSSTGFGDGTLGAFLNVPDNVSEASEELGPPDPKDWDPGYSDEQLLGDPGEASSSGVTAMDVSEVSNGMSRLGTDAYLGPGQGGGPVLVGHQHGQSPSFSGQSRSNGIAQGSPGSMANGKGVGLSPKHSAVGQQQLVHSQHPPKHASYPSTSRLRSQGAQAHYGSLQTSPEASSSAGAGPSQIMGDSGNNVPNGHLPPAQRGRLTGASHPVSGMGHPGVPGSNVWPTSQRVQVGTDANFTPWSQGYSQSFIPAQNSLHDPSCMNRRPARLLPPTAPGKTHGNKRSA